MIYIISTLNKDSHFKLSVSILRIQFKFAMAELKIENFMKKGRECILGLDNLSNHNQGQKHMGIGGI